MQRWFVSLLLVCAPLFAQEGEDVAFSVSGRVVTAAGRPCAGASVHLWDALAGDRPLARTIADEAGNFELAVPLSAIARRDHPFGPVRIEAHQAGRARVGGRVRPGAKDVRIVLPKPAKWTGVVRDPKGNPLPGAPIIAEQGELRFATTTDANGEYTFAEMGDGRVDLGQAEVRKGGTWITLTAEGHASKRFAAAAGERVDVKLDAVPIRRGRVIDAKTKQPLAGVRIVALGGASPVAAVSDSEGRFALEVEVRYGQVAAYLEGYAVTRLDLNSDDDRARDHELPRAEAVRGNAVDTDGNAVPFADVLLDVGFGPPIPARCDEAGVFRFPFGITGFAKVSATRRGYRPGRATVDANWRADDVRVVLARGRAVSGTVLLDGTGVLGAEVIFQRWVAPGMWKNIDRAYTNAKGTYVARAVPPEATHAFARAPGARTEQRPVAERLNLTLANSLPYSGTVVDDEGKPLAGVEIIIPGVEGARALSDKAGHFSIPKLPLRKLDRMVMFPGGFNALPESPVAGVPTRIVAERIRGSLKLFVTCAARRAGWSEVVLRSGAMVRRRWLPAASKAVEFEHLAEGKYVVELSAPGYIASRTEVELTKSQKLDIQLERAGTLILTAKKGARIVVQTLDGEPSPFVSRRVTEAKSIVPGFGPGLYRFIARAEGEIIVIREVAVGATDAPRAVDLTGGAAASLTVTVTDADGKPLEGASIDLVTPGGFVYRTSQRTDAAGSVTLGRLILGPLRVVARFGDQRADKGIRIDAGSEQSIAIELR